MGLPQSVKRYTPQEYYALEQEAEGRSDYYKGEIFAMSGGSPRHSLIASNLVRETGNRLKGRPCKAYGSDLRLKVSATGLRCYPDVSVYCQPLELDDEDVARQTCTNPTAVFEVLSKTTEAYDRGFKAENFRRIPSLSAYVLVSQEVPHVEIYERESRARWVFSEAEGRGAVLSISALSIELPLSEIYDGIDFSDEPPLP